MVNEDSHWEGIFFYFINNMIGIFILICSQENLFKEKRIEGINKCGKNFKNLKFMKLLSTKL